MSSSWWWRPLLVAGGVIFVDQSSKWFLANHVSLNSGVAFGVASHPWLWTLALSVGWGGGVGGSWWYARTWPRSVSLWLVSFWSAAASNILDRWIFGGVRDPLWFPWWSGGGKNNVADWVMFFSSLALLWYALRSEIRNSGEFSADSHNL